MIKINEIKIPLDSDEKTLKSRAAKALRCDENIIKSIIILKKAIDSRKKENICFVYNVAAEVTGDENKILRRASNTNIEKY